MSNEKGAVKTFRKIEHGFVKVEDGFLFLALIVLTASIVIQIVCRYLLKIPSPWCEELARYLFIALVYIGSGRAFINGGHINIDLMDSIIAKKAKNPEKAMSWFIKFSTILTLAFIVSFFVVYYRYLTVMARHPQTSASMHIDMMIPMSMILIGTALMIYHCVCRLFYTYEGLQLPQTEE